MIAFIQWQIKKLTDALDDIVIFGVHIRELSDAHNNSDTHCPTYVQKFRVLLRMAVSDIRHLRI